MKIRKNSETRKAKSRDAARVRRGNESEIFSEIGDLLPIPKDSMEQMDKISILRLAVCYLKSLQVTSDLAGSCHIIFNPNLSLKDKEDSNEEEQQKILDELISEDCCVDGFFMIISKDGSIVFSSESVVHFLGIQQLDLMGNDIHDFTHLCDHQEMDAILSKCDEEHELCQNLMANSFCSILRLKSTITGRGKSVNIKQAVFKVLRLTGRYMKGGRVACVFESLPNPNNLDNLMMGQEIFLGKHSLDMKFTFADKKISDVLGFSPREIISNSFYNLYHVSDADNVLTAIKNLFQKGQSESSPYRLICKSGGYVWIVSQWTLVRDTHSQPSGVLSINYVISRVINQNEVLSELQLDYQVSDQVIANQFEPLAIELTKSGVHSSCVDRGPVCGAVTVDAGSEDSCLSINCQSVEIGTSVEEARTRLSFKSRTVTTSVFAPRTEDMNSGFLMPDEGNIGLTIVDDVTATDPAQDLTHLAPEAGDTYIPLDLDNLPSFDGLDMDDLLHDIDLMNASPVSQSSPSDCQGSPVDDVSIEESFPHATSIFNTLDFPRHKFEDRITGDSDSGISSISGSPSAHRQDSIDKSPVTGDSVSLGVSTDRVSPLNNDPFLSFTGNATLDPGRVSPSTLRTAPSLDFTLPGSGATLYGSDTRCTEGKESSSVWDSPPSSSSSSFGTSDLDLCADFHDDAAHRSAEESSRGGTSAGGDFPLLNDDSIWESFVRSSLSDIMSPDGFLPDNNRNESIISNSTMKPPPPPLPLTSNLAMLLQQTLPQVKPQPMMKRVMTTKGTSAAVGSSSNYNNNNNVTKFISEHTSINKSNGSSLPNIVVQNGIRSVRLTAPAITLSDGQLCGNHFILSGGKLTTATGEGLPTNSHIIINYDDLTKKSKGITSFKTLQIQGKVVSGQNHSVIIAQNLKRSNVNEPPSPAVKKFRDSTTEPMPVKGNSVLMNLLVNGEDVNNGYSRSNSSFNLSKCFATGSR